jgi:protein-S-isoprenylcysteine O-methyltransferase Ste14
MGRVEERIGKKHRTPDELEHRALTLQAIGWLLLAFDGIVAVFVFVGIRTGSWLWLYWTVIEGVLGIGLIAAGLRLEQIGSVAMGHSVKPHLHAGEDAEHREAA